MQEEIKRLDPLWDELFPAKEARIVALLVERIDFGTGRERPLYPKRPFRGVRTGTGKFPDDAGGRAQWPGDAFDAGAS